MRLVTRYILREHVGPLVFAVTTLTSLLLLNYISKSFGNLVGKGLSWRVIGEFFALSVPFTVAMTLPMAVLIATLYAFSRMAADREISALMACGVSTRQLMTPVLASGLALSLVMVAFNDQLLPRANHRLRALTGSIAQKKPTLALKPQILNTVSQRGLYMWMSALDSRHNSMRGVTIYDLTQTQVRRTIVADSGVLAFAQNERDLLLTLYDGYVQETRNAVPDRFQRLFFETNIMRVADVANELVRDEEGPYKSDREMTVCEMQHEIQRGLRVRDSTRRVLGRVDSTAAARYAAQRRSRTGEWYCAALAALSVPRADAQGAVRVPPRPPKPGNATGLTVSVQAEAIDKSLQATEEQISAYEVEIQKKFAISLACLIFALLGPPIALRFPRAGVGLTIGVSLVVFAVYYIGLIAGEKLADDLILSPIAAMWAANVIFGLAGIVLVFGMGRQPGGSGEGGVRGVLSRILPRQRSETAA